MNSLSVERLSFERDDVPILENLDFEISSGEIVQFAGHNGCGKTTLMRIVAGLILPSRGSVKWNGGSVQAYDFRASLLYLGHQVGVKLTMTPLENLRWYFGLNGRKSDEDEEQSAAPLANEALHGALASVGLSSYENVPCYQLSAGQQRRVALARLYLTEAPLWLLDEPFTAIDKHGVADLEALIERHAERGGIIVLTTHQTWNVDKIRILDLELFKPDGAEISA